MHPKKRTFSYIFSIERQIIRTNLSNHAFQLHIEIEEKWF